MPFFDNVDLSADVIKAAAIALVLASAIVLNSAVRLALRLLTRRAVRRALDGRGRWRVRLPRTTDGKSAEQRRVQRADAAAHMLSRLSSLVVAGIAVLIVSLNSASHDLGLTDVLLVPTIAAEPTPTGSRTGTASGNRKAKDHVSSHR